MIDTPQDSQDSHLSGDVRIDHPLQGAQPHGARMERLVPQKKNAGSQTPGTPGGSI
jgi:hypothetical protein